VSPNIETAKAAPVCPECGAPMVLREARSDRAIRKGPFWGCSRFPSCKATHGAHPDGQPLGLPADKETKRWRIVAHEAFDRLWEPAGPSARAAAYRWLSRSMALTEAECHIGRFSIEQCKQVIELAIDQRPFTAGRDSRMKKP